VCGIEIVGGSPTIESVTLSDLALVVGGIAIRVMQADTSNNASDTTANRDTAPILSNVLVDGVKHMRAVWVENAILSVCHVIALPRCLVVG
jgi:hypothetical protein